MIDGRKIAVVVPAYNEETQIGMVIESMPEFVDRIIIVNDCSKDKTAEVVLQYIQNDNSKKIEIHRFPTKVVANRYNEADQVLEEMNKKEISLFNPHKIMNTGELTDRIILINHTVNGGVGAAIATGYKWCKDHEIDCTAVMAGDGQMDPNELEMLCLPVLNEGIDYVKGNRLRHPSAKYVIPQIRFIGNSILSMLTKIASGYWRISDTQTGYTTISLNALRSIKIHEIYKSYGMPNDLLVKLKINQCSLKEITIKPVYRVGEQSKMKVGKVIRRVSWLLLKLFFKRLWTKYFFRDFHPLFLFYNLAFVLTIFALPYFLKIMKAFITGSTLSYEPLLAFLFLSIGAFQSLFFAMWMDIQDNERLYK
jgi:glycosyltransferase involved in cell wall biosynthesis